MGPTLRGGETEKVQKCSAHLCTFTTAILHFFSFGTTWVWVQLLLKGFISVMALMAFMAPMALMVLMAGYFFVNFWPTSSFACLGKCVGEWETIAVTGKQLSRHNRHKIVQKSDPP